MKRIAYYGGSFDPVHRGHLSVARTLGPMFGFDEFYMLPAYHAPHKPDQIPASALHRFAMLCIATSPDPNIRVSSLEIDSGEKRYTVDTLRQIKERDYESSIFFVMGADSWSEITTWKEWERFLSSANHVVVSRPGFNIDFSHVTSSICERIIDLRGSQINDKMPIHSGPAGQPGSQPAIYITDAIEVPVSGTSIRNDARDGEIDQRDDVPEEVAKYIEKYELYR